MAEYFVGPLMEKLINACFEYLKDQVRWQTGMHEELQSLRENHPKIKAIISAYSQVGIEDPDLNRWLWQLRDAIDEADDVLDEFEYWKLAKQVRKNKKINKVRSLMKSLKKRLVKICKRGVKIDPRLKRLKEAVQKLHRVSDKVSTFRHLLEGAKQEQQLELHKTRETGSLIKNDLIGRSKEMEFVRKWLRKTYQSQVTDTTDMYRNISVLSVVGHGGMGKTTLLQHVYENGVTEEFDAKMWACVSINFDAKTVIKNILESLKKEKINFGPLQRPETLETLQRPETLETLQRTLEALQSPPETLEALQRSLRSEVTCKRFLLVLDDIWEEDERKWEDVLAPLCYGSAESKILITTRMESVASMFANMIKKRKVILRLMGLEEDECLQLFNTYAFAGVENPDDEFRSIAREMVNKLSNCPLAAKVIGGILNDSMDKSYWKKVINTDIGNIEPGQKNYLLPILRLSYIYLPKYLQNCFSFCCIFPQDHEFDKDDLVQMWIALGFIQSSNIRGETLEDTGRRYFNILVQKSFFDEFRTYDDKVCYKMHDLLHELAQFVSTQECCRVADNEELSINPPPETIRHLFIKINESDQEAALQMMERFKNLRSLFLSCSDVADENVISKILKASKNIRLLVISKIPRTIGCLIHLRYLKSEDSSTLYLPGSISHLHHLQFIISKSLRILNMAEIGWKESMPNENCQLITDELIINDPSVLLMESMRRISSFRSLQLWEINKLVSFPIEIEQWFLQHSSSLFGLVFILLKSLQSLPFSLESLSSLKFLVLFGVPMLELLPNPPVSLVTLTLQSLRSLKLLPSSLSTISSLETLTLTDIPLLESLPDLPSSLKYLNLRELKSLQCIQSSLPTFSSLETLYLERIPLLESLPDFPSSIKDLQLEGLKSLKCLPSSLSAISSLETLKLENIPFLESLPDLPSSVKLLELESLQCLPSSLLAISCLETLKLIDIPLLKSLPDLPPSLRELYLKKLENLDCLPSCVPTSLNKLEITNVPQLLELPDLPSSVELLHLIELESLQCLPSSLSAISSLETLKLENIPLLKSLPDLPASLNDLYIAECHPKLMKRYKSFKKRRRNK